MKNKTINFVSTRNITITTFFLPFFEKLIKEGYKINIICSNASELKQYFQDQNNKISYYDIKFPTNILQFFNPFRVVSLFFLLFKTIKELKSLYFLYSYSNGFPLYKNNCFFYQRYKNIISCTWL